MLLPLVSCVSKIPRSSVRKENFTCFDSIQLKKCKKKVAVDKFWVIPQARSFSLPGGCYFNQLPIGDSTPLGPTDIELICVL